MDKNNLRDTMLSLTKADLMQAEKKYQIFLASTRLDQFEPIDFDEQAQAGTASELAAAFDDQAHDYLAKIARLKQVDFGPKTTVGEGAAVRVGDKFLVVAVSTAEFECEGRKFMGVSPAAPIFAEMEGKRAGEICTFGGRDILIAEVF